MYRVDPSDYVSSFINDKVFSAENEIEELRDQLEESRRLLGSLNDRKPFNNTVNFSLDLTHLFSTGIISTTILIASVIIGVSLIYAFGRKKK